MESHDMSEKKSTEQAHNPGIELKCRKCGGDTRREGAVFFILYHEEKIADACRFCIPCNRRYPDLCLEITQKYCQEKGGIHEGKKKQMVS